MNAHQKIQTIESAQDASAPADIGQIVLVLQGGGALGAYQAGVYQALHEAGDRAGLGDRHVDRRDQRKPDRRQRARKAYRTAARILGRVETDPILESMAAVPWLARTMPNWGTVAAGVKNFFRPNPLAFLGQHDPRWRARGRGLLSTTPAARRLSGNLIDFIAGGTAA